MNAIVVFDTKHGSTADMAARIAGKLGGGTRLVYLGDRGSAKADLGDCELVVLGAPVYAGGWSKRAAAFAKAREAELLKGKFAYFSVGADLNEGIESAKSALPPALAEAAVAAGKLEGEFRLDAMNPLERFIVKLVSRKMGTSPSIDQSAVDRFAEKLLAGV